MGMVCLYSESKTEPKSVTYRSSKFVSKNRKTVAAQCFFESKDGEIQKMVTLLKKQKRYMNLTNPFRMRKLRG